MPSEFYIPAFGAMAAVIAAMSGTIKVLWNRNIFLSDKLEQFQTKSAMETAKALVLNNEALRESTVALGSLGNIHDIRHADGSEDSGSRRRGGIR